MRLEEQMQILNGRYRLEKELDQGRLVSVWRATEMQGERKGLPCAIKHVAPTIGTEGFEKAKQELSTEVRISKQLRAKWGSRPNLLDVYSVESWEGDLFLIMEYEDGKTLRKLLTEHPKGLGNDESIRLALQLCNALFLMHRHTDEIIHRDVKPENILITPGTPSGQLVLIDYTHAWRSSDTLDDALWQKKPSQADDVYAAALVLVEMLIGPEGTRDKAGVLRKVEEVLRKGQSQGQDLASIFPDLKVSKKIYEALRKVFAFESVERTRTIHQFEADLTRPSRFNLLTLLDRGRERQKPCPLGEAEPSGVGDQPAISHEGMIWIPPGEYPVGVTGLERVIAPGPRRSGEGKQDPLQVYDEPSRRCKSQGFWIDATPVTNRQYAVFVAQTRGRVPYSKAPLAAPYNWIWKKDLAKCPPGLEDNPVVLVSWYDANAYAKRAGKRLPTGEEWEIAARGPDGLLYPWGTHWDAARCNNLERLLDISPGDCDTWEDWMRATVFALGKQQRLFKAGWEVKQPVPYTTPVSLYPEGKSRFGVWDMAGNVWEWTGDSTAGTYAVLRGGSWLEGRAGVRTTARIAERPDARQPWIGFRCVDDKKEVP